MDGLTWLLLSWAFVGGLCYLALTRLGNPGRGGERSSTNSPTSTAPTKSDEWTNEVIQWLFNNLHKIPDPLEAWVKSLNEAAKKVTSPTKCEILFEGFGDHSNVSQPPKLSNIRVEHGPRDHLTVRSHIHLPHTKLKLVSSQRTNERMIVSNFDASIVDLRGEIAKHLRAVTVSFSFARQSSTMSSPLISLEVEARLACIANQLYVMGCFNGRPEMEIELTNTDPNYNSEVNRSLVEDAVRRCLLSAVTNVNLSETSLPFANKSSMPRMSPSFGNNFTPSTTSYDRDLTKDHFTPTQASNGHVNHNEPVSEIFKKMSEPTSKLMASHNASVVPNKLRVCVTKAQRLGGGRVDVVEPYVIIEMDEPAQKHQTTRSLKMNPFWEETFDFDLTPASEEILFEVYDAKGKEGDKTFLGLTIVNFEEIRRSGEAMHMFQLQGRPYKSDAVDGMLTCKFDFYYDPNLVSAGKKVDQVTIKRNDGSEFRETVSTQRRQIYDPLDNFDEPIIPTKTTTISVKAVERQSVPKDNNKGPMTSVQNTTGRVPESPRHKENPYPFEKQASLEVKRTVPVQEIVINRMSAASEPEPSHLRVGETSDDRGRGREKANGSTRRDRSFFSDLRERLSGRGKKADRARSVDVAGDDLEEAVSLPPSRDHSQTRWAGADGKNRRYFETQSVGGKSGESTKSLYQHSTLLLEIVDGQEKKYFLIPPNILNEPEAIRLLKKGKKLHIYNEHTFVAVKIKGGALCNVCQGRIGRSFSKQAYQCRDCKMVCHKSCHYKTDTFCTESTVSRLHMSVPSFDLFARGTLGHHPAQIE
ncbi:hypothetical protein PENTCL1PPCAC_28492 [Pristionchus entomophagus]|uniref:Uncharacterized protein n=1 Tax=Pristionchus entomophagus TaxID=358040 RepID=A0AAV5UHX9_9BILA|nr:hypothetical protein PENTCL1PPCAC_28492 [Pristionchus entomophagus]